MFIAICRSLNIPARLDKSLMLPEYWADGAFRVPVSGAQASKGTLLLRNIPGKEWIYAQHWTLGRLEKDHFVTMNHAGLVFEKETLELLLPVGIYRRGPLPREWMPIPKTSLSSDWSLQPDSTKLDSLVIAHQPRRGEYVPGPCPHRPSSHGNLF